METTGWRRNHEVGEQSEVHERPVAGTGSNPCMPATGPKAKATVSEWTRTGLAVQGHNTSCTDELAMLCLILNQGSRAGP